MEFVPLTSEIADEWDRVVYHSDDGWAFSLVGWLEMVAPIWQMENRSFAIRENGKLAAVMPLHYISNGARLSSSGWGMSGPIIIASVSPAERKRLWRACLRHTQEIAVQVGATHITIAISPLAQSSLKNHWGVNPLTEFGYTDVSTHTRMVRLTQSESELWFGLAQDARQQIKRARVAGYTVRRCAWCDMVNAYYRVHVETYTRTGVKPHPKVYFEGIADQRNKHHVLWVGFDPSGTPVAFHNDARFGVAALYHTGCSETAHLKSGVNYLLFWEAMLGERADGCMWYETGEAFPQAKSGKDKGLTDFKGKFGGELHRSFRGEIVLEQSQLVIAVSQTAIADQPPPTFRRLLRNWLRATRDLLTAVFGQRLIGGAQRVFFSILGFPRRLKRQALCVAQWIRQQTESVNTKYANPPISFVKPYWAKPEKQIGFSNAAVNSETARDQFIHQLRVSLVLPEHVLIVPTGSGRTAMELALRALKRKNPDRTKVIIPTYGCKGTFDPVVRTGLSPIFVDINTDLLMDSEKTKRLFAPDVLACLVVHLCGAQIDTDLLFQAARQSRISIIEDSCQATGMELYYPENATPDFRIYSFGMGKNVMATTGGSLVAWTYQEETLEESKNLQHEEPSFARIRFAHYYNTYFPSKANADIVDQALNEARLSPYNFVAMNPLDALIVVEQLRKLREIVEKRQQNAKAIRSQLKRYPTLFSVQPSDRHVYTKLSVVLKDAEHLSSFRSFLATRGIETESMYMPLHLRDFGRVFHRGILPVSESIYPLVTNIPVRPNLTKREVERIAQAVERFGRANS